MRLQALVCLWSLFVLAPSCSSSGEEAAGSADVVAETCPIDLESFNFEVHSFSDLADGSFMPSHRHPVELAVGSTGLATIAIGFLTLRIPSGCLYITEPWYFDWSLVTVDEGAYFGPKGIPRWCTNSLDKECFMRINLRLERDYREVPVDGILSIRLRSGDFVTSYLTVPVRLI